MFAVRGKGRCLQNFRESPGWRSGRMSPSGDPLAKRGCALRRRLPVGPSLQLWVPPNPSVPAPATSGARQPSAWEGTARHWLVRGTRGGTSAGRQTRASPAAPGVQLALPCPPSAAPRCETPRAGASAGHASSASAAPRALGT